MPSATDKLALLVPVLLAALFYWVILHPSRWLAAFFFSALLLPPLPLPLGNSGVHVAPLFALLGLVAGVVWIREWRSWSHPVTLALVILTGVLLESLGFAAFYSGWEIAIGSLARVLLFAIGGFVFLYSYSGPQNLPIKCDDIIAAENQVGPRFTSSGSRGLTIRLNSNWI